MVKSPRRVDPYWLKCLRFARALKNPPRRKKNSQMAPAQRVAMKMGRRPRCSSVTYQFRYAPSIRQSGSDRLTGGPF